MWPTRRQTPKQLAVAAVWSVVFYIVALLLAWILHRVLALGPGAGLNRLWAPSALVLAVLATGVVAGWQALSLLREGIRLGRWQEDEVDALRRRVERPVWTVITWLLFFLVFACLVLGLLLWPRYSIFVAAWVLLWMPANLITGMRSALRRPERSQILELTTAKAPESKS